CLLHKDCPQDFSIDKAALSLPILVDSNNRLITCSCRVQTNRHLHHKKVQVHCISWAEVLSGHTVITPLIELLPISERVLVGFAIERELGKRQGQRTDLTLVHRDAQVRAGIKSRTIAANLAGFSSHFLYELAKEIVKKGCFQLIQAMDSKLCTISKA